MGARLQTSHYKYKDKEEQDGYDEQIEISGTDLQPDPSAA
jgi:hypothetical protein